MAARNLDGIVASSMLNVFYLTGFNGIAHKADEPRPCALVLSRSAPEHPILVIADYYLGHFFTQPTWVEDIRPFRSGMAALDLAPTPDDIDGFTPEAARDEAWIRRSREHFGASLLEVCRRAVDDLGLGTGRVAFDDLHLGHLMAMPGMQIADGYDPLMFARQVKTEHELRLLREATRLNQTAIERTVSSWQPGMSWRQLNQAYHEAAVALGGFVRDPGAMVLAHLPGMDPAVTLQTGLEDFDIEPGMHVMFDCHGTRDLYCWDGGKTWVVDGEPSAESARAATATARVMETILSHMRPGVRVSELQAKGRDVFRECGMAHAESALIFFHGLGLSHMDMEQLTADGKPNTDWAMERGMVAPVHLLYPGGERQRIWLEEVALVGEQGAEPLFSWGFEPLTGRGVS
jgi:Xaa-Pro aminopeptidase